MLNNSNHHSSAPPSLEHFVYHRGFLQGQCSDLTVRSMGQSYRLHRLLLLQSPLLQSQLMAASQTPLLVLDLDPPAAYQSLITRESLGLCLAFLYSPQAAQQLLLGQVNAQNGLSLFHVLACAYWLQLWSLCEFCLEELTMPSRPMNASVLLEMVGFVTSGFYFGSYTQQLALYCLRYLHHPSSAATPSTPTLNADSSVDCMTLYAQLPFHWLKLLLEHAQSQESTTEEPWGSTEFEKFQFAKQVIEQRRLWAQQESTWIHLPFHHGGMHSGGACHSTTSSDWNQLEGIGEEERGWLEWLQLGMGRRWEWRSGADESVVLRFDKDAGGRVAVMEHLHKKPYLKHSAVHESGLPTGSNVSMGRR